MTSLHIALEDGFDGDTVTLFVDDEEVFRKQGVTTRTQISLADSLALDVPEGPVRLRVEVPSQGVEASLEIDPTVHAFVGLSLRDGGIQTRFPEQLGHL
jgi:hypothetical protein